MAETSMAGQTVALAAVLAAVTFLLYFLKHALDAVRAWYESQRQAERLICALYAEIESNLRDMQAFLDDSEGWERAIGEGNASAVGYTSQIGHDLFYETSLRELSSLPRAVIYKIVSFYSQRERLSCVLDRLEAMGREEAASEPQITTLRQAREIAREAVTFGHDVLYGLEVHAPMELVNAALRPQPDGLRAKAA
jgi:hypothetical protein